MMMMIKERYLNLTFEETGSTLYIYMYWCYLNLTFEETGSTVTTNAQIVHWTDSEE